MVVIEMWLLIVEMFRVITHYIININEPFFLTQLLRFY